MNEQNVTNNTEQLKIAITMSVRRETGCEY